ncbi:MAG: ribosome recycling factor [bacterium]|nr:ribosome recycling factor [bacterium]
MTLDPYRPEFEKTLQHLLHEMQQIRTGRATPALVEDVPVEAYGAIMRVKELATITVPDARNIQIDPWDQSVTKDIERGIRKAQPMLNPVVDGKTIRVPMPELTEDSRKELTKRIGQKVEESRQSARHVREKARTAIVEAEREGEVTEDDKYRLQKQLDELSKEYDDKIKDTGDKKSREIMTV